MKTCVYNVFKDYDKVINFLLLISQSDSEDSQSEPPAPRSPIRWEDYPLLFGRVMTRAPPEV